MAISLKIKGNKRANEGIGNDLVSLGDNRFPVIDAQYPGTKGATDFIVIRHLHDKSIYTIVCKNVTPCDSNREGTLYISVAVPVKEQVKGMFNLLIELQNAFKSNCMTYDGAKFHFVARNEADRPFEEIIARYTTEPYPYKAVMTSDDLTATAYLFMTPEQISDLLNDPMRGEFSRYGEIVLVPVADPSQHVSTLNIPAKIWRSYKIFVNGRQTGQTIADPTKVVTITLPETEKHEAISTTFSINQARESQARGIAIDDEAQIIYLNMQPKEKPVAVVEPEIKAPEDSKPKKKILLFIIAGLCGVLICVGVYFFVLAPQGKEKDAQEQVKPSDPKEEGNKDTPKLEKPTGPTEPKDSLNSADSIESDSNVGTKIVEKVKGVFNKEETVVEPEQKEKTAEETAKERQEAAKKELDEQYNADTKAIEKAETLSFKEFDIIFKRRTNYTGKDGYDNFKKKVEFIKEVVNYIKQLSDQTDIKVYKDSITKLATKANELGLDGLEKKLTNRLKGGPSEINKSKKNNKSF